MHFTDVREHYILNTNFSFLFSPGMFKRRYRPKRLPNRKKIGGEREFVRAKKIFSWNVFSQLLVLNKVLLKKWVLV